MYKIRSKRKPELVNGKVKRTGRVYYEVCYWTGHHWSYRDFDTRSQAKKFTNTLISK